MIGRSVGRYRITALLGTGGMGSVWRADDTLLEREVALKFLPETTAGDPEVRRRFLREARAASQLDHPGIATVYDAGESDGMVYIAMLLVEGESIRARLERGRLPIAEAVRIAIAAAEPLGHAHQRGVLHRDISSGNLMVTATGRVVVVDFGLALPEGTTRLTQSNATMGTVAYLAPEVVNGATADLRSDLYGLGLVLFEMLTGRLPFGSEPRAAVLYRIVHQDAPAPSALRPMIPEKLDHVVLKLLAKRPAERYPSATGVIAELAALVHRDLERIDEREVAASRSITMRVATGLDVTQRRARRAILRVISFREGARLRSAAIVLALVGGTTVTTLWQLHLGPFASATHGITTLAVLPLANKSADPAQSDYLIDGICEQLAFKLGEVSGIRVLPWVTSRRFADTSRSLVDVAKELHVDALIMGTFRLDGSIMRTNMALVEGRRGLQEWAMDFEEPSADLFDVQKRVALAIASRLKGKLSADESRRLVVPPSQSAEAYDCYLRGSAALGNQDEPSMVEAMAFFISAAGFDPGLAEAYVGIGAVYEHRYLYGGGGENNLELAESNFKRALAIRPGLSTAERGLIDVYAERNRLDEALSIVKEAEKRGSLDVDALMVRGVGYTLCTLPDKGIPILERVLELDPANQAALWFLAIAQTWSFHPEDAIRSADAYLKRFGDDPEINYWSGCDRVLLGDLDAALKQFQRARQGYGEAVPDYFDLYLALLYRRMGDEAKATEALIGGRVRLEDQLAAHSRNPRLVSRLVQIYAALHEADLCCAALRRLVSMKWSDSRSVGLVEVNLTELEYLCANDPKVSRLADSLIAAGFSPGLPVHVMLFAGEDTSRVMANPVMRKVQLREQAEHRTLASKY